MMFYLIWEIVKKTRVSFLTLHNYISGLCHICRNAVHIAYSSYEEKYCEQELNPEKESILQWC